MALDHEELTVKLYNTDKQEARIVDLREYVIGAVASSMPPEFPKEALKPRPFVVELWPSNAWESSEAVGANGSRALMSALILCTAKGLWI